MRASGSALTPCTARKRQWKSSRRTSARISILPGRVTGQTRSGEFIRRRTRRLSLEAESGLELDHPACQSIRCSPELRIRRIDVQDVGWRTRGNQGRKVQDVESVKKVGTKFQFGRFSEESHSR